jgi:hypothetical protein
VPVVKEKSVENRASAVAAIGKTVMAPSPIRERSKGKKVHT